VHKFSADGTPIAIAKLDGAVGTTRMLVAPQGNLYITGSASTAAFPTRNALEVCNANTKPPQGTAGVSAQSNGDYALVVYQTDGTVVHSSFFGVDLRAASLSPDGRYLYAYGLQPRYSADSVSTNWIGFLRFDLSR
jgi:hypothetical protein